MELTYRPVKIDELERIHQIESDGFPEDEAASLSTIKYRHSVAPKLFIGVYLNDSKLIGFINATCSNSNELNNETFKNHELNGKNVLIHSICIDKNYRKFKVATNLLLNFIELCMNEEFSTIILVCHDELKLIYTSVGFIDIGPSQFVHGNRPWFKMILNLPIKNLNKLKCPIETCRCIILDKGIGKFKIKSNSPLPITSNNNSLPVRCWLVPNPTSFENIGFSKPLNQINTTNETRWLSCGACDFGPLGWTESNSNLANQFNNNPTGQFSNVLFLLDSSRIFEDKN